MAYRIRKSRSLAKQVRRIACEQIDRGLAELADGTLDRHEAVHQVRKRFKKIRGLLRLVRPGLGPSFDAADQWFRDAGRELSRVRDAESVLEAVEKLAGRYGNRESMGSPLFTSIQEALHARRQRIAEEWTGLDGQLTDLAARLREQRDAILRWKLTGKPHEAVLAGLTGTYKQSRKALSILSGPATDERWHDWRKGCKNHWYHLRLLRDLCRPVMRGYIVAASELSELLGDDHDLVVLTSLLASEPQHFETLVASDRLQEIMRQERTRLQAESLRLGGQLFAESPRAFRNRMACWWDIWAES